MNQPHDIVTALLWLFGGLGIFIFGIDMMGWALRRAAGLTFRKRLDQWTKTPLRGLFTGAVITGLMQSSSASTVMIVGLIHAGLLSFKNSIGIILGANIGTTFIAQITAFELDEAALPLIGIGFLINLLSRRSHYRELGKGLMGFGLLFFGLMLMKLSVSHYHPFVQEVLQSFSQQGMWGWLGAFLMTCLATAVVQSSAAIVVIIQAIAISGGITEIDIAIPMILGASVGTCITAMLASLRSNALARRAAVAHLVFNIIGAVMAIVMSGFYMWLIPQTSESIVHQIANCHLAIKLVNVFLFLPFARQYGEFIERLVPEGRSVHVSPEYLNAQDLNNPKLALENARREISRMYRMSMNLFIDAIEAFQNKDEVLQEQVVKREEMIDILYYTIADYTRQAARNELDPSMLSYPAKLFHIMNQVERIGDHAENVVELSQVHAAEGSAFTAIGLKEFDSLMQIVVDMGEQVSQQMENPSIEQRDYIRQLRRGFKQRLGEVLHDHKKRVSRGKCKPLSAVVFIELLDNLASVVAHFNRISSASINKRIT